MVYKTLQPNKRKLILKNPKKANDFSAYHGRVSKLHNVNEYTRLGMTLSVKRNHSQDSKMLFKYY